MFKQIFLAQDSYHKHIGINVHKTKCMMWQKPSALLECKKFQKVKFMGIFGHW
jgi:catechol-2,3-dioxygenase